MATHFLIAQEKSTQQYISKDKAAFIANLTPYQTYNKLNKETREQYKVSEALAPILLGMAGSDMSEEKVKKMQEDLADTEKFGLVTQKDVYIWAQQPDNPSDELYEDAETPLFISMVLPITDGGKFRKFLDRVFGDEKTKAMTPTGNAMNLVHNQTLINWNKERLIIARSTVEQSFFEEEDEFKSRNKRMLLDHANALSKVKVDQSIAKDANYQKHLHKDSDFDVWVDYKNIMPPMNDVPMQARELVNSIMEFATDMQLGANGFFKDGVAEIQTEMYTNDAMTNIMAKSYNVQPNKDFFKYLDNTNLMGLYTMGMNVEGFMRSYSDEIYKVLGKTKEGEIINNMLDIVDIFIDEDQIYSLFKGDMLMALTDIKVVEREISDYEYNEATDKWDEVTTKSKEMMPLAVMMMSYGNEENIMKFIKLGANAGVLSKKADGVWAVGGVKDELGFDVFVIVKDGILMFTNDENIPNNLKGLAKDKLMSSKDIKEVTSHVQYGFMDVAKATKSFKKAFESMDKKMPSEVEDLSKMFKRMEVKTMHPQGNEINSVFRIEMQDEKTNVLQSAVDTMMKIMSETGKGESDSSSDDDKGTKKL